MSAANLRCPHCKENFKSNTLPGNLSAVCPRCNRVMRWFYAQNNQRYGPLLFAQLSQLVHSGVVQSGDWVYQEGTENWVAAREVPELGTTRPATAATPAALENTTLTGVRPLSAEKLPPSAKGREVRPATGKRKKATSGHAKLYVGLAGFGVVAAVAGLIVILVLNHGDSGTPKGDPPGGNNQPGQQVNQNPGQKVRMTGQEVYKKALPSTVWIVTRKGTGSGSLIDKDLRLVITNAHVVPLVTDNFGATVEDPPTIYFPMFKDGKLVAEKEYYPRNPAGAIPGKVVLRDTTRDLALVQLDRLPPSAVPLPLAAESSGPGETVHAIGNPGASGALWVYTSGSTRNVYHKTWQSGPPGGPTVSLSAKVVETQVPANPGDSGGPLVNDYGEQVGVTQGFSSAGTLFSYAIDVSEVHGLLSNYKKGNMAVFPK